MKQLILLLALAPFLAGAQPAIPADQVIRLVNQRIAASGSTGYFDLRFRWKSFTDTDTTERSARVYFDRTNADRDSIATYLIAGSGWKFYYDGALCYQILSGPRTVVADSVIRKGNIKRYVRGNLDRSTFSYFPFLVGKGKVPFRQEAFAKAQIATATELGQQRLLLTTADSQEVKTKLAPTDWDNIQHKEVFEIGLPRYNLLRKQEWSQRNPTSVQYLELNFSPIFSVKTPNLPARVANLDSLLKAGYTLKGVKTTEPSEVVAVGDLMPEFHLASLQGDTVGFEQLSGLVLFDFWYKGCPPCLMAAPGLERLHRQYGRQGLSVLGINPFDQEAFQLQNFINDEMKTTYPTLLDSSRQLATALNITGYPTLLVVDAATRRVLYAQRGYSPESEEKLAEFVKSELIK